MRSVEGKGERVVLFNLADKKLQDDVAKPFIEWAILKTDGEDYAVSVWPITIKVKPQVTNFELRQALGELLISLGTKDLHAVVDDMNGF